MTLEFTLSNSDFLAYHLYASSISELHKKRRFRSRMLIPIIYGVFGIFLVANNTNSKLGIAFLVITVLWFIFHPSYSRWRYRKHFQKHVEESYKNRTNKSIVVSLLENSIFIKDHTSESTVNGTEIKELIETTQHFFLSLTTDVSFIVPKYVITNQQGFIAHITGFGTKYIDQLNWKWK